MFDNLTLTDIRGKFINTKDVKIKIIHKILNKKSIPKCQDKWNNVYNEEFQYNAFQKQMLEIFLNVSFFTKMTSSIG
jgi:hypothetical protein